MATGRPVTMVVCDLKGSTALAERLDSETLRAVLRRYFEEMGVVYESHDGVIAKIIGDAFVAVFDGADDPQRAARRAAAAAAGAQAALTWLNDRFDALWGVRLHNRTGVASGELPAVVLGDVDAAEPEAADVLAGDVLDAAESLEAGAPVMEVLLDDRTHDLIGDAATVEPFAPVPRRARPGTVAAWLLAGVDAPDLAGGAARPDDVRRPCDHCGFVNPEDARWCARCATALGAVDITRESRRTVTVLFADPRPVGDDGAPAPAEVAQRAIARHQAVARPILERYGATVERWIGDAVMAVFGLPIRHEDDAVRAVRAAHELQVALGDLNVELADRFGVTILQPIGVNTGTVVAGDPSEGQRLVTGDAVNVAARLEQAAGPAEVLLGAVTRRMVADAVTAIELAPLPLKGKAEPVAAHRLVDVTAHPSGRAHALPLVGRDDDLAELRRLLRAAVRAQESQRVTVIGASGVGKSRLTHEFLRDAGRTAQILRGRCLAYGEGITFWPLLELVHDAAGITEDDDAAAGRRKLATIAGDDPDVLARITSIAGLTDDTYDTAELIWALRSLVEAYARDGPVILVVDDLHWAEPTLVEALDRLAATVAGPVLLLCSARPVALEQHRDFIGSAPSVVLGPLTAAQCEQFLRLLLGEGRVDPDVVLQIAGAVGGNPLFLEQFVSMLIDEGRLRSVDGRWEPAGDLSTLDVPASIEAVLSTRLDRLPDRDRPVVGASSVIGRQFPSDGVASLIERSVRPDVIDSLAVLTERELVEPMDDDESDFRFQHQLIRDAAYHSLLKESRAVLHERLVRFLDERDQTRDRSTELTEIQGYHLERAYTYWRELGLTDRRVVELGLDAAHRLRAAGERALARGDMPAAASLLLRAADLLPDDHAGKPRVLLLAGGALDEAGWFDRALRAFDESARLARDTGASAAAEAATIARARLDYITGRATDIEQVGADVEAALDRLTALADPDALSRAWQLRLDVDIANCRWAAAQHAAGQLIDHAGRAGNVIMQRSGMRLLAFLAQKGPMPVAEATALCEDVIERVAADRRSAALARVDLALLTAMRLDFDRARAWCREAREVLGELGADTQAALISLSSGPIELSAGDPAQAEAELRRDYLALDRMGERNFISLTAALLAEAVYRQQRYGEAAEMVAFAREVAAHDDLAVHVIAASVEGKLTARRGDPATGVALVREAVELIETTEDPSGQGDVWLDLAEALHLAGEHHHAVAAAGESRERYLAKGNLAGVRRADRMAQRLRAGRDPQLGPDPRDPDPIVRRP